MNDIEYEEELVLVQGTRLKWRGLSEWLTRTYEVNATMRCSAQCHGRAVALYKTLTIDRIRNSVDIEVLRKIHELLRSSRYTDAPLRYGLGRAFTRAELGVLISEADNQIRWVENGCPAREKGPRLDPRYLPDDRLDFLIQRHRDIDLVEKMRAEKRRRMEQRDRALQSSN
jgi:hypothetical protein